MFLSHADFTAFEDVLREALEKHAVDLYDYCAMTNHFHFVVRPPVEADLVKFMHWLTTTHATRWRLAHRTVGEGAVYQGRYKAIPVETSTHFLTLCRYVEHNPVRAGLVKRAEEWRWSTTWRRTERRRDLRLAPWPVSTPPDWLTIVNTPQEEFDLEMIRRCVNRGCPLGNPGWQEETAKKLGILHTLRKVGRPPVTRVADSKK